MDMWFYYDVTHRLHTVMNPLPPTAVDDLIDAMDLPADARVLDLACGKGEWLVRMAERLPGIEGVGVDISPGMVQQSTARQAARAADASLAWVLGRGEEYAVDQPFDAALCIGASWIWNGYAQTLSQLAARVVPGGLVVLGEPYWRRPPPAEYLAAENATIDEYATLEQLHACALERGLQLVWMQGATQRDWDRYEMLQAASVDRFRRESPDHAQLQEILDLHEPGVRIYLQWGRETLGFALWAFRTKA